MTLQLEEGKYYWDGYGERIGPMYRRAGRSYPWAGRTKDGYIRVFLDDGTNMEPGRMSLTAEWVDEPTPAKMLPYAEPEPDVRQHILDTAGKIVNGDRRGAYGTPENNFGRIAAFWNVYFANTGRDVKITAADVSPMMRLMKEARLCENPAHLDSLVDIVGYTLTGAEVSGVKITK